MDGHSTKEKTNIYKNFAWSIKEIWEFKHIYIILLFLDAVFKGFIPVISTVLMQNLINALQNENVLLDFLIKIFCLITLSELFQEIFNSYFQFILPKFETEYRAAFQIKLLKKASCLDAKTFENSDTYDLISRVKYDADTGILGYVNSGFETISCIFTLISYITILIYYNIFIIIVVSTIPIIRYFVNKKLNIFAYITVKKNTHKERKSNYYSWLITNSDMYKEIKLYDLFGFFIEGYKTNIKIKNDADISMNKKIIRINSILSVGEIIVNFFVLLTLLIKTYKKDILVGDFILYVNAINGVKKNVTRVFQIISTMHRNSLIIDQLQIFLKLDNEKINVMGLNIDKINQIRLINVSYKYKDTQEYVLKDINISICTGESIAILGLNGSGKSTLIKIIMGIYHDYEGRIYINDIDLKQIDVRSYRMRIGGLFQDFIRYEASIRKNIAFGNMKKHNDDYEIYKLLDNVGLEEFKEDIDLKLGYEFNGGRQISIGQWQKISLARAMIKDADVYIMDEPNSALDMMSEKQLFQLFENSFNDKIAIMVVHKFKEFTKKVSNIIVLDKGHIVEMGSHEGLLNNEGLYYTLYSMQNDNT